MTSLPRPLRVLLVEDSADDAQLLERELCRQGFAPTVERVASAAQMIAALRRQPWDVVLSGHSLPCFSPEEVVRTVQQQGGDLPVLVVGGPMGEERAVDVMRSGTADWIAGNRLARLGAVIERELQEVENRRQRRQAEGLIFELKGDLQRRVTEFETLLNVIPIGIAVAEDPQCRSIRANPAFARMLGTRPDANISLSTPLAERPPYHLFRPGGEEIPAAQLPMQVAARDGQEVGNQELEVVTADGRRTIIYGSASPLFDEQGQPRGSVGAFVDVTAMKSAEATLRSTEKLAVVGRLTATIAHEINNPLEAVGNILYMLKSMPGVPPRGLEFIGVAQQELERIAGIVRTTLGFYREPTQPVPVKLQELLASILSLYERKLAAAGVQVQREFRVSGEVIGFPGELRQVFTNLVVNAADALLGRSGRLRLRLVAARDRTTGRCGSRVTVADNGPGIPDQHLNRLFEPFFTTKGEQGTGLGLWVTQGIVNKHGGSIRARSCTRTGRSGTVFSVFLPARQDETVGGNGRRAPR